MNNSICTLFDNILIDIHKFKSLQYTTIHSTNINLIINGTGELTRDISRSKSTINIYTTINNQDFALILLQY